jgi:hypothetical protein
MKGKYVGDPAFAAEIAAIREAHRQPPLTDEEREKLKTVVTRKFNPLHRHRERCWEEPMLHALGHLPPVYGKRCRVTGSIVEMEREKEAT